MMTPQSQPDIVKAISDIAATMPLARKQQLYEFALFLKSRPLPTEELYEEVLADEAVWDAQFAATDDTRLSALVASVESEIKAGNSQPMFDKRGKFIERR